MSRLANVFSIWDYLVFICLLLSSSLIGIFFAWRSRNAANSEHFFTGGRKLAIFPVAMSLVASFTSTNTLLGIPAEVFQIGTQFVMQNFSLAIVIVLAAEVFMPVYFGLGITSVNEYLFQRYNSKGVKLAGTIGFLMATMPYMAVALYGPAIALSSVIRISIPTSILVVGAICTFYTSIGGIKAVIWTDVLQCILMFVGIAMVIIHGLIEQGGFWNIVKITNEGGRLKFFNMKFDIYNNDNLWNVFFGLIASWGATFCAKQTQVQRYLSMRSVRAAKRALYFNLVGMILLATMAIFCGMILYAKYRACDPVRLGIIERHDQIITYYVMSTLSQYPGLAGLFVAALFSGSLSTLSSGFNALAAIVWEDLLKGHLQLKQSSQAIAVKMLSTAFGLLAIAMSFGVGSFGTVLQAGIKLNGAFSGPLFSMFAMGLMFRFANSKGALAGFIGSVCLTLTLTFGAIAISKPKIAMATSFDSCPQNIFDEYLAGSKMSYIRPNRYVPYYEPVGIARFLHISYLLMSPTGFLSAVIIGSIVSWLTNGSEENAKLDEKLLSPWSKLFPPYQRRNVNVNGNDDDDGGKNGTCNLELS